MDFIIKRCKSCGAMLKVLKDCKSNDCGFRCCGERMNVLVPNSIDAAVEKHVPEYEIVGNKIKVKVNHVMEEEHYIEWIAMIADDIEQTKYFKPGDVAEAEFDYRPNVTLYSYCNKHELWKKEVK